MKIGLLLDGDIDFPGGVQTYLKGLYQFLLKAGHQPSIISGGEGGKSEKAGFKILRMGKAYVLPGVGTKTSISLNWVGKQKIKKTLEEGQFDLLHLQALFLTLGAQFLEHAETPTVATFHNYWWEPEKLHVPLKFLHLLLDRYIQKLDARIAVSQPAFKFVNQIFPGDYTIIPPGIDLNKYQGALRKETTPKEPITILYVGRLDRRKGILFLLEAFKRVQKTITNTKLVVVGKGSFKKKAQSFVSKHNLKGVEFVGFVEDEKLPRYYAKANIYCSPATQGESFGIVLLEAMASGLPVVAFANAGYREVLVGKGARFLVPPKDIEKLTEVLSTLIEDRSLRREMSRWSLNEAKKYSWENVGPKIIKVYEKVVKPRLT